MINQPLPQSYKDKIFLIFKLISIGFVLAGLGMLIGGLLSYRSTTSFIRKSVPTTGAVINNVRSIDSEGEDSYYPVIKFQTAKGESVEFKSNSGSSTSVYEIGGEVPVLYDPANPQQAEISSFFSLWLTTIILSILGAGFGVAGVVGFLSFSKGQICVNQ